GPRLMSAGSVLENYKHAAAMVRAGIARTNGVPGQVVLRVDYNIEHPIPQGTVIDGPDAWKLVRMGRAEPADEECRVAAGMTPAQIQQAAIVQEQLSQGLGRDFAADEEEEDSVSDYTEEEEEE